MSIINEINNLIEESKVDKFTKKNFSLIDKLKRRYNLAKDIYKNQGIIKTADYVSRQIGGIPYKLAHKISKGKIGTSQNELLPIDLKSTPKRVIKRAKEFAKSDVAKIKTQEPNSTRPSKFSDIEALRYERNRMKNLNVELNTTRKKDLENATAKLSEKKEKIKNISDQAQRAQAQAEIDRLQKKHDQISQSISSSQKRVLNNLASNPTYIRQTNTRNPNKYIRHSLTTLGALGTLGMGNKILSSDDK